MESPFNSIDYLHSFKLGLPLMSYLTVTGYFNLKFNVEGRDFKKNADGLKRDIKDLDIHV